MIDEEKKQHDEQFADRIDSITDNAQKDEENRLDEQQEKDYEALKKTLKKNYDTLGEIDDHYTSNLPTFMIKDYLDGKFGERGSKDAKVRLAYFMMNNVQSKLKEVSNAANIAAGKAPMFADTQSDYDKIRQTNMMQGLENRWTKNKQTTQNAINLLNTQGIEEQDARNALNRISRNSRLNAKFGMLNEQQKAYVLKVLAEIGDDIKDADLDTITAYLIGGAMTGNEVTGNDILTITGLKVAPDVVNGAKTLLQEATDKVPGSFSPKTADGKNASIGGGGGSHVIKTSDGWSYDVGAIQTKEKFNDLVEKYDEIRNKYINGEMDKKTAEKDLNAIYNEASKHKWFSFFVDRIAKPSDVLKTDTKTIDKNAKAEEKARKKRVDEMQSAFKKARNSRTGSAGFFTKANDEKYGDLKEYQDLKSQYIK